MTDTQTEQEFRPTVLNGDDAADALIGLDPPSRKQALFDVYRAYGWPQSDRPGEYTTAKHAWDRAQHVHPWAHDSEDIPPRGVPVYWGGINKPGLVGISAGHGLVAVSTLNPERVIVVGINWVTGVTQLSYLGWTEDFMGHQIMWSGRTLGGVS